MSIEIKEMVVTSTITSDEKHFRNKGSVSTGDIERIKRQITAECKDMIRELLNERRER